LESVSVRCNAKVNLYLKVIGRRTDGYHDIATVYHSISLHDTLTLRRGGRGIRVTCDDPRVPLGERNLVFRAVASLLENSREGADIAIEKRIPMDAGLGGGSADAAGALIGIDRLFDLGRTGKELESIASAIGADVKFLLHGGCALGVGKGDNLSFFPPLPKMDLVLVVPDVSVSTGWAYDSLKMGLTTRQVDLTMIKSALGQGDATFPCEILHNDFESLIFERYPLVGGLKSDLLGCGASGALMSGSGPVVYGVFSDPSKAQQCSKQFLESGYTTLAANFVEHGVTVSE
jgi:4-diphosphocytidyl-2-C-methyl-D-erythritol kinase